MKPEFIPSFLGLNTFQWLGVISFIGLLIALAIIIGGSYVIMNLLSK